MLQRLPLSVKRIALEKHTLSLMQSLPSRVPLLYMSSSLQYYSTAAKAQTKPLKQELVCVPCRARTQGVRHGSAVATVPLQATDAVRPAIRCV